jgi:hypothetical protein
MKAEETIKALIYHFFMYHNPSNDVIKKDINEYINNWYFDNSEYIISQMEEYASLKQDELIEKIWDKIMVSEGVINENDTTTRLEYESYGKNSLGFREFLKSFK